MMFGGVLGRPLDTHFLLGSRKFMVTALGSCVNQVALISGQDWSPHMSFILKGSQSLALQLKGWFKSKTSIQEYRNEIKDKKKLILNLCMNDMVHVLSTT